MTTAKKICELVICNPNNPLDMWKYVGFRLYGKDYMRATELKTGRSYVGRILYPKRECPHVGNWRDARRYAAFDKGDRV